MSKPYNSGLKTVNRKQRGFFSLLGEKPSFAPDGCSSAAAQFPLGWRTELANDVITEVVTAAATGLTTSLSAPPAAIKLVNRRGTRYILFDDASTIADVFALRCRTSPNAPAYREFHTSTKEWVGTTWREIGDRVALMREGLRRDGFQPGERLAIMQKNSSNWVLADQAAFAHGMVPVPLFVDDRPDNVAFIINDAEDRKSVV